MTKNIYHSAVTHLNCLFSIEPFEKYFLNSATNYQQLSKIIKQCQLDRLNCRFNVWRLCLGVVTKQTKLQEKRKQIQEARAKYQQKKEEALKIIIKKSPNKEPVKKNPLLMMGSANKIDNKQIQTDQFLKQQIQKDVERTYQQMYFFQDKYVMKLLNMILFIWCRRNPDVSYKQGMNQLLASVLVCYFKEAEFKHQRPQNVSESLWNDHLFFNSVQYAQSDIYAVFEKIIEIQGDMFKTEADVTIKTKVNPNSKNNTPILQRIMHIKDHKLKHMDLQLFRIIKLQDVQTKSFMLRWIRCMHTRQFDLQNSFVIWDSIFLQYSQSDNSKKNKQFEFIDAMCLAMFMYMRSIVFTKETAGQILQVYQKYPQLKRGQYLDQLITLAWTICQQLRNQVHSVQVNQSNWFQQSQKVQALHFMQKKQDKKQINSQSIQTKHHEELKKAQNHSHQPKHIQTELQSKKHLQTLKKHSDPLHHHPESVHKPQKQKKQKTSKKQKQKHQIFKETHKQKDKQIINSFNHKSEPAVEKKQLLQKEVHKQTANVNSKAHQAKKIIGEKVNQTNQFVPAHKVQTNISISLNTNELNQMFLTLANTLSKVNDPTVTNDLKKTIQKLWQKVKEQENKDTLNQKRRSNQLSLKPQQNLNSLRKQSLNGQNESNLQGWENESANGKRQE